MDSAKLAATTAAGTVASLALLAAWRWREGSDHASGSSRGPCHDRPKDGKSLGPETVVAEQKLSVKHPYSSIVLGDIKTEDRGEEGTKSYRRFFLNKDGQEMSPWHDVPLLTDDGFHVMVTEIPKMMKAKMEISTKEASNPIAQDMKKGNLREYHGPIFWNYGFLPQTWEDPKVEHPELKVMGDNDPLDVVEIGSRAHDQGEIQEVKVLGALAMIDDGELDWKIIAISKTDPMAEELNTVADVDTHVIAGIREWFRRYKIPDGKPLNHFGFGEAALDRAAALNVIEETHEHWQQLRKSADTGLWTGQ